ncbi:MAG: sterol desaturase family protein [Rhodospirillales bacterium]|jgi:sterol desaturase/sphingolipid hydroxylase (fatty acid hydroxylase superfamily)|nr:sterol desaturase family protein [Rhodospirillales bacterium]
MAESLAPFESAIRLGFFFAVLAVMVAWEVAAPRRTLTQTRRLRWPANLGIVALNTVLLRVLLPVPPLVFAALAEAQGWGVFNMLAAPGWFAVAASVVVLDLAIYLQHVMFHAVPVLWRLHRMHHADLDIDVTTGARFHPIEIVLSALLKMAVIALIGAPALAVLVFEVVLNATAMFNHANARVALGLDRVLRWFVVTPDMHRVHHSIHVDETNSNFGFNLPWWDRLFGTYRGQPRDGHAAMTIGIEQFRQPKVLHLHRMLAQPFVGAPGSYALGRRRGEDEGA